MEMNTLEDDQQVQLTTKSEKLLYRILVSFNLYLLSIQGQKQHRVDFLQRQMTVLGFQKIFSYMNYANHKCK